MSSKLVFTIIMVSKDTFHTITSRKHIEQALLQTKKKVYAFKAFLNKF